MSEKLNLKTPVTYYGGKQNLVKTILPMLPKHSLYCEPFCGGAAIFFAKETSAVEVLNDTNRELMNFYFVVKTDFVNLEREVLITLHSRDLFRKASVIYNNPDMFSELKRAWALWVLSSQGFAGQIDSSWGYDVGKRTTTKKIMSKKASFTQELAIKLQDVQLECADALYIIKSRDRETSFFYVDPPYYNSDMGHYDGYSLSDFTELLELLASIKGKFLLSSYPSPVLKESTKRHGWYTQTKVSKVSVAAKNGQQKDKTEVLTANYPI
ncbi:MAG: DNA adenine methylase [Bacteroidales bacterium]|nr:DNA adenine methylase [Bacteroidales bacterium]